MTIVAGGTARRGNERTAAQQDAMVRNLLHQPSGVVDEAGNLVTGDEVKRGRNGFMSKSTKSTVKTRVDTMWFLAELGGLKNETKRQVMNEFLGYTQQPVYLTFVTLTLPADQVLDEAGDYDDKLAYDKLLRPFLLRLQRNFGVQSFIWVAEPQEAGNIHYHLLIDKYIDNTTNKEDEAKSQVLTKAWNQILAKNGYIEAYRQVQLARHANGFAYNPEQRRRLEVLCAATGKYQTRYEVVNYPEQVEAYAAGMASNWECPNTVDIHKLKAQNNVKGYLCKYLTKNDGSDSGRRKINGQTSGCSDKLRNVEAYTEAFSDELRDTLIRMEAAIPGSVRAMVVTPEGTMSQEMYDDNELAGRVPVMATIYSYSQALFWKFSPWAFRKRFEAYYREKFREIYTPHLAAKPSGFDDEKESQRAPVAVLA
jgi:hypothetical protein